MNIQGKFFGIGVLLIATLAQHSLALSEPEIVAMAKPAVVQIIAFDSGGNVLRTGTGFFISANGFVQTNFHVVEGAASIAARTETGAIYPNGKLMTHPDNLDVAVLGFDATNVQFLKLGVTASVVEGQRILVIGNPVGLQGTVSDGIVSAFRQNRDYIQITAPISPGSSGSPVLDESGKVIAMVTLINVYGQNLNFAIS